MRAVTTARGFSRWAAHGYRTALNFSDYTIFVGRPDRTRNGDGAYSPDIALGAAQYAGSVYDKGGYVYAAGVVLSSNPPAFAIADHDRDFRRVSDVARYEGEHIVLFNNDRRLYNQTRDHSRAGATPSCSKPRARGGEAHVTARYDKGEPRRVPARPRAFGVEIAPARPVGRVIYTLATRTMRALVLLVWCADDLPPSRMPTGVDADLSYWGVGDLLWGCAWRF